MWQSLKQSVAQIATEVIEAAEDLDTSQDSVRDHGSISAQQFAAKRLSDVEPILPDNGAWQPRAGEHDSRGQSVPGAKGENATGPQKASQRAQHNLSAWQLQEKDEELQHLRAQNSLLAERLRAMAAGQAQASGRHAGAPNTGTNGFAGHSESALLVEVKELKERLRAADVQKQSELDSLRQQHTHALQEVQQRANLQVAAAAATAMENSLASATQQATPDAAGNDQATPASTQAWVQRLAEKDQAHAKLQKAYASALRDMQDTRRQLDERKREAAKLARELADAHAASHQEAAEKEKLKEEIERLSLGLNESQRSSRDRCALSADAERRLRQQLEEAGAARDAAVIECQKLKADVARLVGEGTALKEANERLALEVASLQEAVAAKAATLAADQVAEQRIHELEARLLLAEAAVAAARAGPGGAATGGTGGAGACPDRQHLEDTLEGQLAALRQRLMEVEAERDRSKRDLARLKKHLLDKEEEDAAKLTEEAGRVALLEATREAHTSRLAELGAELESTRAELARARSSSSASSSELSSQIAELTAQLRGLEALVSLRNTEVANLQSALGQFYAESEMHEKVSEKLQHTQATMAEMEKKLQAARAETASVKEALEASRKEVAQMAGSKETIRKLQEEGLALRRALERSMGRMHRITKDSDYLMDRRIVNKLIVTYFERGHSKEVLALMSRMFGFTEEEKERVGLSNKGGGGRAGMLKGLVAMPQKLLASAVRGVTELSDAPAPDTDQSFMDLWVDFLIKEAGNERPGSAGDKDHLHPSPSYSPSLPPRTSSNLSVSGDGDGHLRPMEGSRAHSTSGESQPPSPRHPAVTLVTSYAPTGPTAMLPPMPPPHYPSSVSIDADRAGAGSMSSSSIPAPVLSLPSSFSTVSAGHALRQGGVEGAALPYSGRGGHAAQGGLDNYHPHHGTGGSVGTGSTEAGLGAAGYGDGPLSLGARRGPSPAMQELSISNSSTAHHAVAMWLDSGRAALGKVGSTHSSTSSLSGLSGLNSTLEDISLHSPTTAQAPSTQGGPRGPQVPSFQLGAGHAALFHSAPSSR